MSNDDRNDDRNDDKLKELSSQNYNVTDFSQAGEDMVFVQNATTYEGTSATLQEVQEKGAEQVFNEAF